MSPEEHMEREAAGVTGAIVNVWQACDAASAALTAALERKESGGSAMASPRSTTSSIQNPVPPTSPTRGRNTPPRPRQERQQLEEAVLAAWMESGNNAANLMFSEEPLPTSATWPLSPGSNGSNEAAAAEGRTPPPRPRRPDHRPARHRPRRSVEPGQVARRRRAAGEGVPREDRRERVPRGGRERRWRWRRRAGVPARPRVPVERVRRRVTGDQAQAARGGSKRVEVRAGVGGPHVDRRLHVDDARAIVRARRVAGLERGEQGGEAGGEGEGDGDGRGRAGNRQDGVHADVPARVEGALQGRGQGTAGEVQARLQELHTQAHKDAFVGVPEDEEPRGRSKVSVALRPEHQGS